MPERRPTWLAGAVALPGCLACSPIVEVGGVYFPGWLVSAVAGVVLAYVSVWWLGRRRAARSLGESGVFFVSLTLATALCVWWIFFSRF